MYANDVSREGSDDTDRVVTTPCVKCCVCGAQTIPGVQWQRGPQASGFTPETDNQPAPVSSDTLYLLRRLLSNQHTLTSAEFREELTKIVGEATQAEVL